MMMIIEFTFLILTLTKMIGLVLVINAILGIIGIEYTFIKCASILNVDEKRDSQNEAFRRLDLAYWRRIYLYPGAMTLMLPRIILGISSIFTIFIGVM